MTRLPIGKLPADLLEDLLQRYASVDERVIVGPAIGEDAAIIEMGDRLLVATTDPVTFATDEIGWYAVHVNANDLACCGATPRWLLATLLLPENATTPDLAESIFRQISEACGALGVSLCGGHTEITYGLYRPIVVAQMLGEAPRDGYVTTSGAQVGDALILTKEFAVEGTALIVREKRDELRGVLSEKQLKRCACLLREPGISVVQDAQLALEIGGVHALHDPTEGGVAMGLWELAQASSVGLVVEEKSLPVLPECDKLCGHFGLNPLGLLASGSLLVSASSDCAASIVERLQAQDIMASVIGKVVDAEQGCNLRSLDGTQRSLPRFARDEIARLFG